MSTRPPPQPVTVRKMAAADIEQATDVLARAFDDDPFANFVVKQDARRVERLRGFMRVGVAQLTFPYGETYVREGFEGVALWNPPGGRPHGLISDLKLTPAMFRATGLLGMPRVLGALNRAEAKHPKEPHYYLLGLGVEPSMQGRSIGTQLMAPVLAKCDAERMPAYLESSKERNVPLYERNGFKVVEVMDLAKGGPTIWRMWREPQ